MDTTAWLIGLIPGYAFMIHQNWYPRPIHRSKQEVGLLMVLASSIHLATYNLVVLLRGVW